MPQIKISLGEKNLNFVSQHQEHGYSSKSAIIEAAVTEFEQKLKTQKILESAQLYNEIYAEDLDLQELTDDAAGLCLD